MLREKALMLVERLETHINCFQEGVAAEMIVNLVNELDKKYVEGFNAGKLFAKLECQEKTQADIEYETDKAYWRNRTLADEEIISSAEEAGFNWSEDKGIFVRHSNGSWIGLDSKMVDFARAILKKASEK